MSNCVLFALGRWITRGGYLVIRRSRHGFWWHVLWCADLRDAEVEHYVPQHYAGRWAFLHKLFFRGHVATRDLEAPRLGEGYCSQCLQAAFASMRAEMARLRREAR